MAIDLETRDRLVEFRGECKRHIAENRSPQTSLINGGLITHLAEWGEALVNMILEDTASGPTKADPPTSEPRRTDAALSDATSLVGPEN